MFDKHDILKFLVEIRISSWNIFKNYLKKLDTRAAKAALLHNELAQQASCEAMSKH